MSHTINPKLKTLKIGQVIDNIKTIVVKSMNTKETITYLK